ncbi:MAG: hypothetical protein Nkreftii_002717 [Candidatus Nitrospira kreftii]|uniref:Uncharacterized protein n=1 Tax=Candidatus Nitrospira kreftii TaxID=2652173 RepID=A0A7S8FFP0_9BACT|nr:MAG: hypothetical protein Nkreftii_002717 [Candidatus Nitrospira kreftii]
MKLRTMPGILGGVLGMVNDYQQFCLSTGSFSELSGERSPHMMLPGSQLSSYA